MYSLTAHKHLASRQNCTFTGESKEVREINGIMFPKPNQRHICLTPKSMPFYHSRKEGALYQQAGKQEHKTRAWAMGSE